NAYLRFVKGLAALRQGHPKDALPLLREAAERLPDRAGPRLTLAMAQAQSGSTSEARKTLAAAAWDHDWDEPRVASQADQPTVWVSNVIRREAESMILPNLPGFLQESFNQKTTDKYVVLWRYSETHPLYVAVVPF